MKLHFSILIPVYTSFENILIIIGGLFFGIIGMVVAAPTHTVLKVILKELFAENKIVKSLLQVKY